MVNNKTTFFERFQKNWLSYSLLLAMIPSMIWWFLLANKILLNVWKKFNGFLPESIYYALEEFIALNSHNNDLIPGLGFWFIILYALVFQLLKIFRILKVEFSFRDFFVILILSFFILQMGY